MPPNLRPESMPDELITKPRTEAGLTATLITPRAPGPHHAAKVPTHPPMRAAQAIARGEADVGLMDKHRSPRIDELSDRYLVGPPVRPANADPGIGMNQPARPAVGTHDEVVDTPGLVFCRQPDEGITRVEKMELRPQLGGQPLGRSAKLSQANRPVLVEADDDRAHRCPR